MKPGAGDLVVVDPLLKNQRLRLLLRDTRQKSFFSIPRTEIRENELLLILKIEETDALIVSSRCGSQGWICIASLKVVSR